MNHAAAALCRFGGMCYHDDGLSAGLVDLPEQGHDLGSGFTVQASRRLVSKEDFRIADQGTGDGYTLLLPARQFTGRMPPAVR